MSYGIRLRIWAPWALFTRPEMKAERVSYDVITPSAARGVIEAIYWKPQIRWVIDRIHVLRPIRFASLRRNELGSVIPATSVERAMNSGRGALGIDIEEDRQQRAAILLRDVEYVVEGHIVVTDPSESDGRSLSETQAIAKHLDQFNRRARAGQCFHRPYLGCREFTCDFELVEPGTTIKSTTAPPGEPPFYGTSLADRDLGYMLHDIDFANDRTARFFRATMSRGVIEVPDPSSPEVRG